MKTRLRIALLLIKIGFIVIFFGFPSMLWWIITGKDFIDKFTKSICERIRVLENMTEKKDWLREYPATPSETFSEAKIQVSEDFITNTHDIVKFLKSSTLMSFEVVEKRNGKAICFRFEKQMVIVEIGDEITRTSKYIFFKSNNGNTIIKDEPPTE